MRESRERGGYVHEKILVKPIKIRLELLRRHALTFRCVTGVIVHIRKEDGL